MVFLDGPKDMYLDVLKIVEPQIKSGGIVTQKNEMNSGHEISVRIV